MISNQSTVVAVFRNREDAERAAGALRADGTTGDRVYVGSYADTASPDTSGKWTATHHHEGGIKGWFKSLFGADENDAEYRGYENAANRGGVIVSVSVADDDVERVTNVLERYNPIDISEEEEGDAASRTTGASTTSSKPTSGSSTAGRASGELPASIPSVEEQVRVGKRSVRRGGVRVFSRVVEQPVAETVNLREEHVRVERQPVNRAATAEDLRPGTEQVIEVEEFAEEPVVQKQARVVEEVRVSKDVSERSQTVKDTARRREVEVENLAERDRGTNRSNLNDEFRRDFQTRYGNSGASYDDYEPAYAYGYEAASDPRYQGRSWDQVETDLRSEYGRRYPSSTWDKVKDSIRYGWDRVTGRSRGASAG